MADEALRRDLIACYIAGPYNDERAKVHLRAMLGLMDERDRLAEQCARLRSALEQLRDDANAADDSCYATLATVHVHRICEEALNVCWQYRPGAPCPFPASCRENGCSAVEREEEARAALADEESKPK